MTSYFDCSDAEGLHLGPEDDDELPPISANSGKCWMCGEIIDDDEDCQRCERARQEAEDDDVECIHGVDLFARCVECKSLAANSGEGDDMQDIDKMMGNQNAGYETTFDVRLRELLSDANTLQLRQIRYSLEREEKKRLEDAQATIRALDPNAPKPRATRRDKGTTRAPKEHAA